MKILDTKIIIVSGLITTIVGCGSGGGSSETTVTKNVNNVKESAFTCFSPQLYQAGNYELEYNSKSGITNTIVKNNIQISQLPDKDGISQIQMKTTVPGVMMSQTDKLEVYPVVGWVRLKEREIIQTAAPQIQTYKFDYSPMVVGWFSLQEGQQDSFSISYDLSKFTSGSSSKLEKVNLQQKMTFVGFKNINVNGVEYNTCQINNEQSYSSGTVISQVFYQSNTGLPLKSINITKDKDGKTLNQDELSLKSYKFNGTELLN